MSILIKGIKMPKCCWECEIGPSEQMSTMPCPFFEVEDQTEYKEKRHGNCPLIELPPHGRLIDADAFFEDICTSLNEMTNIGIAVDGDWLWGKLNDALDNAPTIIEAEEAE